jgi:hypothetical protein
MEDKVEKKEYDEYEIKECAECLLKAEEIKADPEKMAKVQEYLANKKKSIDTALGTKITSMKQLKEKANKM